MTMLPIHADELVPISTADFLALRARLFMPPIAAARIRAAAKVADARRFRRAFVSDTAAREAEAQRHAAWLVSLFHTIDCSVAIDLRGRLHGHDAPVPNIATIERIGAIIYSVAHKHGREPSDIVRGAISYRRPTITSARHECFYDLMREFPDASLAEIGRMMGGFDHTTVLNGVAKHEKRNGLPKLRTSVPRVREAAE